jgi:hypothetical protein
VTPASASAIACTVRRVIGSPSVTPGEQRGEHRGDGQDEQDAGDRRVVERRDEAAPTRSRRTAPPRRPASPTERNASTTPAALDDRDVRQQGDAREHRAARRPASPCRAVSWRCMTPAVDQATAASAT